MKDEGHLVTVDINGLRNPIRSTLEPEYVAELAEYVERKMQLASKECPAGDTLKIAVLAALNIADEYFRARQDGTLQRTGLAERALELERMLDLALGTPESLAAEPDASPLARTAGSF